MKTKIFILLTALAVPILAQAQGFFGTETVLTQAHQAYFEGDFKTMALNLKKALEQNPTDSLVKENVLSLLKKGYEASGSDQMPVDWRLPDEIKDMRISSHHSVKNDDGYIFRVYTDTANPNIISQLQIVLFPDHVVLDKQAGIGTWSDDHGVYKSDYQYTLEGKRSRQPVQSGLYLLNLTLADGTQTKGWFILGDDVNSTSNPRVLTPSMDQVFTNPNPTFSWQNFISPQYKPYERRSQWIGVSKSEPPNYDWDEVWGHYEAPSTSEQITIDSHGDEASVSKLGKGSYVFVIDCKERKKFGDLTITRDSTTLRNFRIN